MSVGMCMCVYIYMQQIYGVRTCRKRAVQNLIMRPPFRARPFYETKLYLDLVRQHFLYLLKIVLNTCPNKATYKYSLDKLWK